MQKNLGKVCGERKGVQNWNGVKNVTERRVFEEFIRRGVRTILVLVLFLSLVMEWRT